MVLKTAPLWVYNLDKWMVEVMEFDLLKGKEKMKEIHFDTRHTGIFTTPLFSRGVSLWTVVRGVL